MASLSNSSHANATPVSVICSVCVDSLTSDKSNLVTTNCGHVFHKKCLSDWYNSSNNGKKNKSQRRYICPKCNKMTKTNCTRDLLLDAEDDTEYLAVVKTVERLRLEKAETIEKLNEKDAEVKRLQQENVESERLRQEKSEQLERLRQDLKRQTTVIEIKTILLGPNKDLLDQQFGQLKWDDLTLAFQNELWGKIPPKFRKLEFNKSVSFSSNTLLRLIKYGPNDEELLLKLIEDYCVQQDKLNGRVTWNDFSKLFKRDLLQWLREKCERPSLHLDELPLTPKTIATLMEAEEDETTRGVTLIAKIVELYIGNLSDVQINDMCRRACMRLIAFVVPPKLEFCPSLVDIDERLRLLKSGKIDDYCTELMLVYISVFYYVLGMVRRRIFPIKCQDPYFIKEINEHPEHWENYFSKYFYGAPSGFSLKLINLRDEMTHDLVMIYLLMSPEENVFKQFMGNQTSAYRKHLLRMQWPFKIKSCLISLTLLHFAALKGNYHDVQFLLCNMDFSQVLDASRFQDLLQICVLETAGECNQHIQERKKIMATFLKCCKNVTQHTRLTNVHIDLLKLLVERGPEVHEKIWCEKQMLLEAAEYLDPDQFHDLAKWLVKKGHSEMLKKRDVEGGSPLDLAIRRINVKPETIQLFRNAGD